MNEVNEYNIILLNLKALHYKSVRSNDIYISGYNRYDIHKNIKEVFFHKLISTTNGYKLIKKYSFQEFIEWTNKLIEGDNK